MDDALLHQMATSPEIFRQHLFVRAVDGPAILADVAAGFQVEILRAIDVALIAITQDRRPPFGKFWLELPKGSGKDMLICAEILWLLAFCPHEISIRIAAADRQQSDQLRQQAHGMIRLNPWLGDLVEAQNFKLVNLETGSHAHVVAADEHGTHGGQPVLSIANEVCHMNDEGFFATLADEQAKQRNGVFLCATNAGTINSWQWKIRELARQSARWKFFKRDEPPPWVDQADLNERRIASSESRFRRLWHGVWTHENEAALPEAALLDSIILDGPQVGRRDTREQIFGGIDAATKRDRTAFVALSRMPEERVKLAMCRSWTPPRGGQISLSDVEAAVLDAHRRFTFHEVAYDPSQMELMGQRLRLKGVPMVPVPFTAGSLKLMADVLMQHFNSRTIALFEHSELLDDLRSLRFLERGGSYRLDSARTVQGHSDTAIAFCLALQSAAKNETMRVWPFINRPVCLDMPHDEPDAQRITAGQIGFERERQRVRERQAQICARESVDPMTAIVAENDSLHPDNW